MTRVFTTAFDGACIGNPGPGGWGAIIRSHQTDRLKRVSGPADGQTTNNRMELTAAIEALDAVRPGATVTMIGDSQYVVLGITRWVPGWKAKGWRRSNGQAVVNVDLWEDLERAIARHVAVTWEWTRGHAGHPLNEEADRLAERAARGGS